MGQRDNGTEGSAERGDAETRRRGDVGKTLKGRKREKGTTGLQDNKTTGLLTSDR